MSNAIRKIRTISTEGMVRHDIEVPEDKYTYGDVILAKVKALFEEAPEVKALVIGIDVAGFLTRREEGLTFTALHQAGFGHTLAAWDPKSNYTGVLITRK